MTQFMTAEAINDLHKAEFAEAAAQHGGIFKIPRAIIAEIGERTRQRFVELVGRSEGPVAPERRHDKTEKLASFVKQNAGSEVSVETLMDASGCSRGTAHKFIADNRSAFRQVARGRYLVVDVHAERTAARTSGRTESDIATAFLGAMTGQQEALKPRFGAPAKD